MNKYQTATTQITKSLCETLRCVCVCVYSCCHAAYRFLLLDKRACPLGMKGSEQYHVTPGCWMEMFCLWEGWSPLLPLSLPWLLLYESSGFPLITDGKTTSSAAFLWISHRTFTYKCRKRISTSPEGVCTSRTRISLANVFIFIKRRQKLLHPSCVYFFNNLFVCVVTCVFKRKCKKM